MRTVIAVAVAFVSVALASLALAGCAAASASDAPAFDERLQALGAEYRELQTQRGHFDGAARNEAIDRWGGRKHEVMESLRQGLAARKHTTRTQVISLLGVPDAQWRADEPAQRLLPAELRDKPAPGALWLWYRWRGTRDGLALRFSRRNDRLELVAWSYTGE
jgi:hypothetical protein